MVCGQASLQKAQGPGVCKLPKPPASRALCQAKRAPRAAFPTTLKGETVPDSLPATPKSPPTRRVPPRGAKSLQLCLTSCDPMDCSLPGSSARGILQARILEWVSTGNGSPALGLPGPSVGDRQGPRRQLTPCIQPHSGSIPGSGRFLEKRMATHSNILAWRIPWTEKSGGLQSTGLQRVGQD